LSKLVNENLINLENPDIFLKALDCYASKSFDFVDTLLWAYHAVEQHDILTFDLGLTPQSTKISPLSGLKNECGLIFQKLLMGPRYIPTQSVGMRGQ